MEKKHTVLTEWKSGKMSASSCLRQHGKSLVIG